MFPIVLHGVSMYGCVFMFLRWVDDLADPVMFSTLENGKMVRGLEGIPCEGPAVLVGYHMLMGFDLGSLVSRFLTEKNILLRGIAHPFMFNRASELLMPDSSSFDGMRLMGAVPASSINFYKLLSRKEFVLLFPGGAREALHRKVTFGLLDFLFSIVIVFLKSKNEICSRAHTLNLPCWSIMSSKVLYLTL